MIFASNLRKFSVSFILIQIDKTDEALASKAYGILRGICLRILSNLLI